MALKCQSSNKRANSLYAFKSELKKKKKDNEVVDNKTDYQRCSASADDKLEPLDGICLPDQGQIH